MENAKEIAKESKSSFYYAFNFLPKEKRDAMNTVYAFCRKTDDIVDENSDSLEIKKKNLKNWEENLKKSLSGNEEDLFFSDLVSFIKKFDINHEPFFDLIKGMEMDLLQNKYESFEQLHNYCYKAASTVGLMCIPIFGYKNEKTKDYAVNLGLAMQLTNILRDVKVDLEQDRIYLPKEDFDKFNYSYDDLTNNVYNQNFIDLMRFEAKRADNYFKKAEENLSAEDKKNMFPARAMQAIYWNLLRKLEMNNFNIFDKRINVSKFEKIFIALKIWFKTKIGF